MIDVSGMYLLRTYHSITHIKGLSFKCVWKNTLRYDNTMSTRLKIMIALCIVILFATLLVILISRIQQGKKNPLTYSIDDLTHDKHDTTDEQRKIHRRAAESEYWERKNIDAGIYA